MENTNKLKCAFYPIVDSYSWVEKLVPLGLEMIQLRIKNLPAAEIFQQASAAQKICAQYGCRFFLNDHWEIALSLKTFGVHLGFEDSQVAPIKDIKASGIQIGLSTHSIAELESALAIDPSYIAFGPIFETTVKKMKFGPQGIDKITDWRRRIPKSVPLAVIGGIKLENYDDVSKAGADIIAVVSDVIANQNPQQRVRDWLSAKQANC